LIITGFTGGQEEKGYFTENSTCISPMGRVDDIVQEVNRNSILLNFDQKSHKTQ
jgi:hypothetical protein